MSFDYTLIKTEILEEGTRTYWGYNLTGMRMGVLLNVRLGLLVPPGVPTRDNTVVLMDDTMLGLIATLGVLPEPFVVLKTEILEGSATRVTRAFATPGSNVLVHEFLKLVTTVLGQTRVTYTDEHFTVVANAQLVGTDITLLS